MYNIGSGYMQFWTTLLERIQTKSWFGEGNNRNNDLKKRKKGSWVVKVLKQTLLIQCRW